MNNYIKILIIFLFVACESNRNNNSNPVKVNELTIGKHIERLASDEFMGRKPFTEGEVKTVHYLKAEFKKLGLLPGNGDSFFQDVSMVEISGTSSDEMIISGKDEDFSLNYFDDFMAFSEKQEEEISLKNSDLIFAGFGIVAPEYGWNDYEGIDWTGKTAVVLVNDPGFKSGDSTLFKGNEMTYYGRWTYKYEEAARQGAAGVLIIHETEPASYGWNVIQSGGNSRLIIDSGIPLIDVNAWVSQESAKKIFDASELKGEDYKLMAGKKGFKPIPLGINVSLEIKNAIKRDVSKNVIALLPGNEKKDQYIIYSAHWDHFGIDKAINGDSIYNGAVDNASGTANLLAIAEAFKKSAPSKRSIVFIGLTAEEQGLLGSAYYAENPIYEPKSTVANINMDAFNSPERMKDLTIIGYGQSELDAYAIEAAATQDRYILPDPKPEGGYFFRSDHFNFAKIGIPALYAKGSYEGFNLSVEEIKEWNDNYRLNVYHQPSDEYHPSSSDLSGIQFDAQLLFQVGFKLANENYFPKWSKGSEFKQIREEN